VTGGGALNLREVDKGVYIEVIIINIEGGGWSRVGSTWDCTKHGLLAYISGATFQLAELGASRKDRKLTNRKLRWCGEAS
jgi:hypothetical protein